MGSKKSAKAAASVSPAPSPSQSVDNRVPHPTDWHGEVAMRLRRLYHHRIARADGNSIAPETVIGIPWETWAALCEERSTNLDHIYQSRRSPMAHPLDAACGPAMSHELYTSNIQVGVDYKNKGYDDAIPVYARGDLPGGPIWFWFYPKG